MKIYKEIAALNSAYIAIKKINLGQNVSRETKELSSAYLKSLRKDVIENNNKLWEEFSKTYNKEIFVDKECRFSISDFDFEKLLKFHESNDVVFNRRCLDLKRNEVIMYFNRDQMDDILRSFEKASLSPRRMLYIYDIKDSKRRLVNRNDKVYRTSIFDRFFENKSKKEKELLVSWFKKTNLI